MRKPLGQLSSNSPVKRGVKAGKKMGIIKRVPGDDGFGRFSALESLGAGELDDEVGSAASLGFSFRELDGDGGDDEELFQLQYDF